MNAGGASRARVGISACLLGQRVRYDGGHKRSRPITGTLGRIFEWVPVCPEVELGLGVPRETLRLETRGRSQRLAFTDSRVDITSRMNAWSRDRLAQLERLDLCGYILKSGSPSCGLRGVKLFGISRPGPPARRGVGLFARALMKRFPRLPIEEETRLLDKAAIDRFVARVLAYRRLRDRRPRARA
jgi:uncharacterized protein YbbK (DUF523 family)